MPNFSYKAGLIERHGVFYYLGIFFFLLLGYQVITTPLPSGGPVLVSMLNILEGFNFTREDQDKSLTYHYIVEAIKFAFAERSLLEDSKNAINITKRILR